MTIRQLDGIRFQTVNILWNFLAACSNSGSLWNGGKPSGREMHPKLMMTRNQPLMETVGMKSTLIAVCAVAVLAATPYMVHKASSSPHSVAATNDYHWSGSVPPGGWLRVRNLSGSIEVRRASGSTVQVDATREPDSDRWSWGLSRTEPVTFTMQKHGSDVDICTVSNSVTNCDPNDISSSGGSMNSHPQAMHIVVQLPADVSMQTVTMHGDLLVANTRGAVIATTGHGAITIHDVSGDVKASSGHGDVEISNASARVNANTGHGDITVSGSNSVVANTGHGNIEVSLANNAAPSSGDMSFTTGHGDVSVRAPKSLSADIELHTGRGEVNTDFPLTRDDEGRHSRSASAHGRIGAGGRSVSLSTGHGDVSFTTD